jgi:hypothetical protein
MYVVANFISVQSARPLLIPGEAIVIRNAKQMVAVVDQQNTVHMRPVTIGRDYGDQTEILAGLQEHDVIVPAVTDEIRDGAVVDPQFPKAQQQASPGGQSDKTPSQAGQYGDQSQDNKAQKTSGGGGKQKGGAAGQGVSPKQGGASAKSDKE